ncbi:RNA polymerase subunit sigma-70 [Sporofaciens sp. JLR.KK001]|uniref:RNA polymerase subunit sigma-70 n=1 Tax=Sporofaciens sp. JLR.KK001 TaxID=3112621 RepID=UPI002FEFDF0E
MDKKILYDYIDACRLIKETEADICWLKKKRKTVIQTNVKGSNPRFPYQEQHFKVQGTAFTYQDDGNLRLEEMLLEQRRENAEKIKRQVEEWMLTIPIRMQRIIRYKIFEEMTWEQTAAKIGRKATGDSVRMEFERFMRDL